MKRMGGLGPKKQLGIVNLHVGSKVEIGVKGKALVVHPARQAKPPYTIEEVLSQCGRNAFRKTRADSAWLADRPVGKEAI
jgi:antitoxin component of MazEF toxin-antitoxin module